MVGSPSHQNSLNLTIDNDWIVSISISSLNIPYIKKSPEEGGTHGIIGQDIIRHFKPDAVLLNFARGELVDSAAMKEFLDAGEEGRYISDFPDDELWNHKDAIILPHLGASTEEAEDQAVRTIDDQYHSPMSWMNSFGA
jgi:D-3-phosphoglycerate dehydrogenase / 2-oxoglutarate reductase